MQAGEERTAAAAAAAENNREAHLKEARGHWTTWHGVIGGHVAHDGAGRRRCTLEHTRKGSGYVCELSYWKHGARSWSTCCNGTATTIGGSACISNEDKYILHLPSFASSQSKFNCYFSKVSFKYPPRAEERGGGRKRGEEGYTSAPLAVKSEVSSCEIKKKVFENLGFWEELQLLVFQGSKGVNRSHAEQGGKLPPPSFNRSRFRHAVSLTVTGSLLQLVTRQSKL